MAISALLSPLHQAIALLCLVLALHFASAGTRRRWPMRLLALTYLLYGAQSVALVAQQAQWTLPASVMPLRLFGAMLLAPLLWWLLQLLRRPDGRFRWVDSLHLAPALLTVLLLLTHSPLRQWLDGWLLISYAGYLFAVAYGLWAPSRQTDWQQDDQQLAKRYVQIQASLLLLNLAVECAVVLEVQHGESPHQSTWLVPAAALFVLAHLVMLLLALQRSHWLQWLYEQRELPFTMPPATEPAADRHGAQPPANVVATPATTPSSVTSTPSHMTTTPPTPSAETANAPANHPAVDEAKLQHVFARWLQLLEEQQLYQLEFGITLAQAARKLQVPARLLSNAVNQCYGASFSVLLNDQRIAHACHLLVQQPEITVTDVMLHAGFASKSNFHKEFLRVTGLTPSQFRHAQPPKNLL